MSDRYIWQLIMCNHQNEKLSNDFHLTILSTSAAEFQVSKFPTCILSLRFLIERYRQDWHFGIWRLAWYPTIIAPHCSTITDTNCLFGVALLMFLVKISSSLYRLCDAMKISLFIQQPVLKFFILKFSRKTLFGLMSGMIQYNNCTTLLHNYGYKLSSWCCARCIPSQDTIFVPVMPWNQNEYVYPITCS